MYKVVTFKNYDDVSAKKFSKPLDAVKNWFIYNSKYPTLVSLSATDKKSQDEFVDWCKANKNKIKEFLENPKYNTNCNTDHFLASIDRLDSGRIMVGDSIGFFSVG